VTGPDVNVILVQLAELRATVLSRLDALTADNTRGDQIHADHEQRIRALEKARWLIVGFALAVGGTGGAVANRLLG
jgi:hypothetical protein